MILKSYKFGEESDIPDTSGLYYFYENDRLLYVGRSLNSLKWRMIKHQKDNQDALQWIEQLENKIFPIFDKKDMDNLLKHEELFRICSTSLSGVQRIDLAYSRVNRIDIEEISRDLVINAEKIKISELKPPFNFETRTNDKIDEMMYKCSEIGLIYLQNWENKHN